MSSKALTSSSTCNEFDPLVRIKQRIEDYNRTERPPDNTGYNCKECGNKGYIAFLRNGADCYTPCECLKIRKSLRDMEKSGLGKMGEKTIDGYRADEKWQADIKAKAEKLLTEPIGKWFFIGGQSGAGKTHICKAIACEFIKKGIFAKYFAWRKDIQKLNARINEVEGTELLNVIYSAPVLFIDDFLKSPKNAAPTQGELNRAIDIILTRYEQKENATIISSERSIGEILTFDQAMGGRIIERAEGYVLHINSDRRKNYRLRNLKL